MSSASPENTREAGFILLEAILALLLITVTMVLFTTALNLGRHTVRQARILDRADETLAALDAFGSWIAGSLPLAQTGPDNRDHVRFEGQHSAISFITLSNGDVFPAGLLAIGGKLISTGQRSAFVVEASPLAAGDHAPVNRDRRVLIRDLLTFELSYFGAQRRGQPDSWTHEWREAEQLPRIIALKATLIRDGRTEKVDARYPVRTE